MEEMKMFQQKETHPSYGMLGFYRVTHGGALPLFGSSIKHRDTLRLVLKTGSVSRELNTDWYYGDKTLFEVEMSATQFADLITNMNFGDGVPVTIVRTENNWDIPICPFVSKADIHKQEFSDSLDKVHKDTQDLIQSVAEKFSSKKSFNKKEQEEILRTLNRISMNIGCNQTYQVKAFTEQMERTVTESKGEIESFFQNKMYQLAQQAFVENPDKLLGTIQSPVEFIEDTQRPKRLKKIVEKED